MATVPTGQLERELRKLYLKWLAGVPRHSNDLYSYIERFRTDSLALVARLGGDVARLGAIAGFPAPRLLDLSPHLGTVYNQMHLAAIRAGIGTGLNPRTMARDMLNAGLDQSYNRLVRIARTETVSAYWKNQWDSTRGLDLVMVWSAEQGPRTCDYCLSRDGLVVEDPNIRDHPNGRCTLVPMLPSKVKYKGTLQPDGSVTQDPRWTQDDQSTVLPGGSTQQAPIPLDDSDRMLNAYNSYEQWLANNPGEAYGDQILSDVYRYMGYDTSLPDLVDAIPDDAIHLFRGLSGDNAEAFAREFLEGKHFAGRGLFGNGSYTASSMDIAIPYSGGSGVIVELGLKPDARILDAASNMRERFAMTDLLRSLVGDSPMMDDLGAVAAILNYDAIRVTHADGSFYYVVLNRNALYAKRRP